MLLNRDERSFKLILVALRKGEAVIMACDTIYGIVGAVPASRERIVSIKGRTSQKPFIQLISDKSWLEALRITPQKFQHDFLNLWPGPFTFVLENNMGESMALRVPADERLRRLIDGVGCSVYSTSVNESGSEFLRDAAVIHQNFGQKVALVEDSGPARHGQASTIVDIREQPCRVLRQGAGNIPAHIQFA